jgi:dTDP-4-dehydrorhamnose reductase
MDTILITGISGFLGWNLAQHLRSLYRIYGTYLDHQVDLKKCECLAFDLTHLDKIERLCTAIQPRFIIHTAALSDADLCETRRREALTLNTFATRELAKIASYLEAKLIYVSTDLIFDGEKRMYAEADSPAPLNYYAKTKYLGELELMSNCGDYVILRPSLLYGWSNGLNQNFLERMEQKAIRGSKLDLFTDQFRTPLYVGDAAVAVERLISDKNLKGLFHLGGPERMSRFEFGEIFCRVFNLSPSLLAPCRLVESGLPAPRPKDCSLRSDKAQKSLNITLTPVEEALRQLYRERNSVQTTDSETGLQK